jgi:Tfp pilus assembly protein PilX
MATLQMITRPCRPRRRPAARSGFALLITITLLAFLVLLLVSLASLTRVETQVAANSQKLNQARQNALAALNIAIGQLQKYAGPDQRTTATADIGGDSSGNRLVDNAAPANTTNLDSSANGLTAVQQGSRRWTGVWSNATTANYTQKPSQLQSSSPRLLNWLVSGNETSATTLTPATNIQGVVAGMSATTKVSINNQPDSGVLLVGGGTVGASAHPDNATATAVQQYVVAPLVTLKADNIPGQTGQQTVGQYAWWIGDEGVKARVDLRPGYLQSNAAPTPAQAKKYSFYSAQRSGVELLKYDATNPIGSAYPFDQSSLAKVVSLESLPLSGTTASGQTILKTAGTALFHDLTTVSRTVLADSYAGGLKKNLTAILEHNAGPADATPIFTPENSSDYGVPNWGMLRSWRQNAPTTTTASWMLPGAAAAARSPIVTYANIMVGVSLGQKNTASPAAYPVYLKIMPVVILWNPYTTALQATDAEITVQLTGGGTIQANVNGTAVGSPLNLNKALAGGTGTDAFVFKISCPRLLPGESVVFQNAGGPKTISTLDGTPFEAYANGVNTLAAITNNAPTYASNPLLLQTDITVAEADIYTNPALETPNTATKFELVPAFGATGANFTPGCNPNQIRVYLSQQGAWAGGLQRDKIYHAVEDVGINPVSSLIAQTDFSGVNPLLHLYDNVDEAFTFKMQASFEGFDDCSSRGDVGFQFLSRGPIDGNLVARNSSRTKQDENHASGSSYFGGICFNYSTIKTRIASGINPGAGLVLNNRNNRNQGAGRAFRTGGYAQVLDLPKGDTPLLSIGQLQSAPMSLLAAYPMYAVGNSAAPIRMSPGSQYRSGGVHQPPSSGATYAYTDTYYDLSWHLNRSLWDKYFMLGVENSMTQQNLSDRIALPYAPFDYSSAQGVPNITDIRGANSYETAATKLMVNGGFNINSTSVSAWAALLLGSYKVDDNGNILYAPMTRFTVAPDVTNSSAGRSSAWDYPFNEGDKFYEINQGQRELLLRDKNTAALSASAKEDKLRTKAFALAELIVREVRKRGPFASVGDFVNRQITANATTALRGAIQTAIDNPTGSGNQSPVNILRQNDQMMADQYFPANAYEKNSFLGGTTDGAFTYTSHATYNNYQLTQADVLTAIGPRLTARSDTFRIRTYGESVNPVTGETARAWCEAMVQRTPDFVDTADNAIKDISTINSTNQLFGRKFQVVSFRWLSPDEI